MYTAFLPVRSFVVAFAHCVVRPVRIHRAPCIHRTPREDTRHGKDSLDATLRQISMLGERPNNESKADFYPARRCPPDDTASCNLAPDDVINLAPTTGTPTSPASADSHADSSASVSPTQREVVCTTHPATKVHYMSRTQSIKKRQKTQHNTPQQSERSPESEWSQEF